MRIEFLQAGTGDSIWISYGKTNIIVDGGKSAAAIKERFDQMPEDENIDLLIVTHIDSDHIAGVIALVDKMREQNELYRLKQVWFNFPKLEETEEYSVSEGNALSTSLCKIDGLCWCNNTSDMIGHEVVIGDIHLYVLAPEHDVAYEYKPKAPDELGVENADWNVELETVVENVDDDDIDEGGPNSQSIVILLECEGKSVFLPGDCTPKELLAALRAYNGINVRPLKLDLMKLPHHGSVRNITKDIMAEIECSNFVISTNVNKKYLFPNKETIAKLIRYRNCAEETINVHFNYVDALNVLNISEEEQADNNIKLTDCREFSI